MMDRQTLLGTLPGFVYTLDTDGCFTYVSDEICATLGYSTGDLIGNHFSSVLHPDDAASVSRKQILPRFAGVQTGNGKAPKLFDERRAGPRKTSDLQVRLMRKLSPENGASILFCNVNASGCYSGKDDKKKFLGTLGVMFNFASDEYGDSWLEKKKIYDPFELFSKAVTHVFSNVFTGIYGHLQLMEMRISENQNPTENIDAIKISVEKAVSFIKQISQNFISSQKKDMALSDLVYNTVDEIFSEKSAVVEMVIVDELRFPAVDIELMRHVLRSAFFIIRDCFSDRCCLKIRILNVNTPMEHLPRIDCKYFCIDIKVSKLGSSKEESVLWAFEKAASKVLSYSFLKKNGGTVEFVPEKNSVQLFLPAKI